MADLIIPEYVSALFMANLVKLTVTEVNKANGTEKYFITKQEACRRCGRAKVEKWIKQGKIKKCKDDTWKIDPTYLQALLIEEMPIYKTIKVR